MRVEAWWLVSGPDVESSKLKTKTKQNKTKTKNRNRNKQTKNVLHLNHEILVLLTITVNTVLTFNIPTLFSSAKILRKFKVFIDFVCLLSSRSTIGISCCTSKCYAVDKLWQVRWEDGRYFWQFSHWHNMFVCLFVWLGFRFVFVYFQADAFL